MEELMDISISRSQNNNLTQVNVGTLTVWFSYETIVAFREYGEERVVSENIWSQTTGRHLNDVDGGGKYAKAERLPWQEFNTQLADLLQRHDLERMGGTL
jgi:hypothetical protein